MPHSEAQAWWADVQHVRETIERRRAGLADSPAPRDVETESRFAHRAAASAAPVDDLDWTQVSATRGEEAGRRADHGGRALHTDVASSRPRRSAPDAGDRVGARGRRDADHLEPDNGADRPRGARRHASEPGAPARHDSFAAHLAPPSSRRTVEITGRTVAAPPLPRLVEVERRRPPRRTVERVGPRPDRVALWAVLLGFFLILVAATSSRGATPANYGHAGATVALHAPAR
jgi:hypothetical protein